MLVLLWVFFVVVFVSSFIFSTPSIPCSSAAFCSVRVRGSLAFCSVRVRDSMAFCSVGVSASMRISISIGISIIIIITYQCDDVLVSVSVLVLVLLLALEALVPSLLSPRVSVMMPQYQNDPGL